MSQPSWADVEATVRAVITSATTGLAADALPVVWSHQNVNAPAGDYVRISLGSALPVWVDWIDERPVAAWTPSTAYGLADRVLHDSGKSYACSKAGTSAASGGPTGTGSGIADGTATWDFVAAGGEIQFTTVGTREVPLVVEGFSAALVEEAQRATALFVVDGIASKLKLPSLRDQLATVGWTVFDPGIARWIPEIVSIGFRGRAIAELRSLVPARQYQEFVSYIASVSGVQSIGAPGGAVNVPFGLP